MRPRKIVMCVCGDEEKLSRRAFLLDVHGYRVIKAENLKKMEQLLREGQRAELLLVECPLSPSEWGKSMLEVARRLDMEMKTLLLPGDHISTETVWYADAVLMPGQNSPVEVLYCIKTLVSRK